MLHFVNRPWSVTYYLNEPLDTQSTRAEKSLVDKHLDT
jgi:hypothetical protein